MLDGIKIENKLEQPEKAPPSKVEILFGKLIYVKLLHCIKTLLRIVVTLFGISIEVRLLQYANI